jgi:predicted PurR-regulated permease PerM
VIRILLLSALLSLFLAYAVAPLAQRVRRVGLNTPLRRPLPRWLGILIVYVAGATIVMSVWALIGTKWDWQVGQLQATLPRYAEHALDRALGIDSRPNADEDASVMAGLSSRATGAVKHHVRETLLEVGDGLPHLRWLWITPVLSLLLLQLSPSFRRTTLRALPPGHLKWRTDQFFEHVNWVLAGYTRAQIISSALIGAVCAALFASLKVPYALSLGLCAGVLELIPIVGPLTVALSVVLLTSGPQLVAALVGLSLLRLVQDYVVYPRLIGRRMHLHPLAVIVALLLGARVGGVVGVALALPIVGVASVAWTHWRDHRAIERLVRDHAPKPRAAATDPPVPAAPPATPSEVGEPAP